MAHPVLCLPSGTPGGTWVPPTSSGSGGGGGGSQPPNRPPENQVSETYSPMEEEQDEEEEEEEWEEEWEEEKEKEKENDGSVKRASTRCDYCAALSKDKPCNIPQIPNVFKGNKFECRTCTIGRASLTAIPIYDRNHDCRQSKVQEHFIWRKYWNGERGNPLAPPRDPPHWNDTRNDNAPAQCDTCRASGAICDVDPILRVACTACRDLDKPKRRAKGSEKPENPRRIPQKDLNKNEDCHFWGQRMQQRRLNLRAGTAPWFRHGCDACMADSNEIVKQNGKNVRVPRDRCSWLVSRKGWKKPCIQCQAAKRVCLRSSMPVTDEGAQPDDDPVGPETWADCVSRVKEGAYKEVRAASVLRAHCDRCVQDGAQCRVFLQRSKYACNRCTQLGIDCESTKDPANPQKFPLDTVARVGAGNYMPFTVCQPCLDNDRDCDRQRPCDSCVHQMDECDKYGGKNSEGKDSKTLGSINLINGRIKTGPLYYLALGHGADGVGDPKDGSKMEHWVGPVAPMMGLIEERSASEKRLGAFSEQHRHDWVPPGRPPFAGASTLRLPVDRVPMPSTMTADQIARDITAAWDLSTSQPVPPNAQPGYAARWHAATAEYQNLYPLHKTVNQPTGRIILPLRRTGMLPGTVMANPQASTGNNNNGQTGQTAQFGQFDQGAQGTYGGEYSFETDNDDIFSQQVQQNNLGMFDAGASNDVATQDPAYARHTSRGSDEVDEAILAIGESLAQEEAAGTQTAQQQPPPTTGSVLDIYDSDQLMSDFDDVNTNAQGIYTVMNQSSHQVPGTSQPTTLPPPPSVRSRPSSQMPGSSQGFVSREPPQILFTESYNPLASGQIQPWQLQAFLEMQNNMNSGGSQMTPPSSTQARQGPQDLQSQSQLTQDIIQAGATRLLSLQPQSAYDSGYQPTLANSQGVGAGSFQSNFSQQSDTYGQAANRYQQTQPRFGNESSYLTAASYPPAVRAIPPPTTFMDNWGFPVAGSTYQTYGSTSAQDPMCIDPQLLTAPNTVAPGSIQPEPMTPPHQPSAEAGDTSVSPQASQGSSTGKRAADLDDMDIDQPSPPKRQKRSPEPPVDDDNDDDDDDDDDGDYNDNDDDGDDDYVDE